MLKLADLTARPDFQVGPMLISPARRLVEGPGGYTHVEPLIMQVFLLLLDRGGRVVTRDELFDQCWGGVYVGDDSLNRAIAKVRRIGAHIAPGLFEIETIPRTGYRLTGEILGRLAEAPAREIAGLPEAAPVSRRALIGSSAAAASLAVGGAIWLVARPRPDPKFEALMERGEDALQKLNFDDSTGRIFEQAVRLQPGNAKAWGSLALFRTFRADIGDREHSAAMVEAAADAARRALALDPNERSALLAMVELEGSTVDWFTRDRKLRRIIGLDPKNVIAMTELLSLVQAAGLNRESWDWNERALSLQPLSPDLLGRRALKLWIAGRTSAADKVIDQARDLYPSNPWVAWVRFVILALTDRARGAQAILASAPAMIGPPPLIALWRACLPALDQPSPRVLAKARQACIDGATVAGGVAAQAVMILCALADVDTAFDVANGFLLWRGNLVRRGESSVKGQAPDSGWRIGTQWLFTPPCAVMRADARFLPLCDGIGLTEYWKRRGVKPDYQLTGR